MDDSVQGTFNIIDPMGVVGDGKSVQGYLTLLSQGVVDDSIVSRVC